MDCPEIIIEITGRLEASTILTSPGRAEFVYLLSIGDQHDDLPDGYDKVPRKLRLLVADVVTEEGASERDVERIIELAESIRALKGKVLIHCEAGVSRSPAAALIMYAYWLGPGAEQEAMRRVLAQRPVAIPNRRMVALADKVLARGGRLIQVLSQPVEC
jgi:predicted protein tyrosine phosphatase